MGWTQENMWSLAWTLGYDAPPPVGGPLIDGETFGPMLKFLPEIADGEIDAFLSKVKPRSEKEIVQMEDVFYCAHNAARAAQLGHTKLVPKGFHPMADAGAIHERRHSLTWAISPGVKWDDTDLST